MVEPFRKNSRWNFKQNILITEQADEPSDVFWEHQGISLANRSLRRTLVHLGTVFLLLVFFWIRLVAKLEKVFVLDSLLLLIKSINSDLLL